MAEGFASVPTAMLRDESVSIYAVMVYAVLASYGGYEIVAPKRETIAKFARCSVRKVADALNELEALGVLERERRTNTRGQATTCYVLITGRRAVKAHGAPTGSVEAHGAPGEGTSKQVTPIYTNRESEIDNPQTPKGGEVVLMTAHQLSMAFDAFWSTYPRKAGKATARKAFEKAVNRAGDPTLVLDGARRLRDDPNLPEAQFIPHPATWLNGDRWEDEPLPARADAQRRTAVEIMADRARTMQDGGGQRELSA